MLRARIVWVALGCGAALFSASAWGQQPWGESAKRGVGVSLRPARQAQGLARLEALSPAWFYSWAAEPFSGFEALPQGTAFVPMAWGRSGLTGPGATKPPLWIAGREAGLYDTLLGFNEPDFASQSNMTVEQALDLWPVLESTGLRLVSPSAAHATRTWMKDFMAGVEQRGLRVDAVGVHRYGSADPQAFLRWLDGVHDLYQRPLWITELGVADWNANTPEENRFTDKQVYDFMYEVLPALERLDYVERYAWFPADRDRAPLTHSSLFEPDGSLTRLGRLYQGTHPVVFTDGFGTTQPTTADLLADQAARQDPGLVWSDYVVSAGTAAQLRDGALVFGAASGGGAAEPEQAGVSLRRNLERELVGRHWQLSFDAALDGADTAPAGGTPAWLGVSLGDAGLAAPFTAGAAIGVSVDAAGAVRVMIGDAFDRVFAAPPAEPGEPDAAGDGTHRVVIRVDETGELARVTVIVNGVELVAGEALPGLRASARFLGFTSQTDTGAGVTARLDNVEVRYIPEPASLALGWGLLAGLRRRGRHPG